jgi:hypothetical protein
MVGTEDDAAIEAAILAKYRATPQFRRAWKIIKPSREHQSECEWWVVHAILRVLNIKEYPSPAEEKNELEKGIKKLRAAIPFVGPRLREILKVHIRTNEILADTIIVEKGKPRWSLAKTFAVFFAYELLVNFGSTPRLAIAKERGTNFRRSCSGGRKICLTIWKSSALRSQHRL